MANKAKKDNKNLIIGICAAVVVVVVIVIAVVLATRGTKLNDDYFVSDDTKYVLTVETGDLYTDDDDSDEVVPVKTHLVYTYSGDEITGLKAYYEFADDAAAKTAYDQYVEADLSNEYASIELDGKYVILTANASEYEDLTADDVKQRIEFMEMLNNMDLTDGSEDDTEEVETVEEIDYDEDEE